MTLTLPPLIALAVILFLAVQADRRRLARLRRAQEAWAKAQDRLATGAVGPFPTARRVRTGPFSNN